jgi:8-oxo-dGTP pyrophosphatase MutT (NUDIX family)
MAAAAPAVPAATVVVLRDGPAGVEAYLQRRPRSLGFAGGLWVFPGGRVDRADVDPALDAHWAGPPPAAWAARLGLDLAAARGTVVAACRETFEEAGLLPAEPPPGPRALLAARAALLAGEQSFGATLAALGARLDTGCLRYWSWWVTPEVESRRYDTRFFVAALPRGAVAAAHVPEAERERWLPAGGAAADASLGMLPPTRCTLREVARFATVAEVLAAGERRQPARILPWVEDGELVMPWGERFGFPEQRLGGPADAAP